jgi:Dual specificity phosphatase, catalytic domain
MLTLPTPNWQDALVSYTKSRPPSGRPPTNTFGRAVTPIIPDRLYLSDYYSAGSSEVLQSLGITHIISVMETHFSLPDEMEQRIKRANVPIADRGDEKILNYFNETTGFIEEAFKEKEENKVLVCLSPPTL